MQKISVIGLGKLGCSMLACFAHKGWEVIGVDLLQSSVDAINAGKSPIYEPGVDELINKNRSRVRATTDAIGAVLGSNVSFIIVPTPTRDSGEFSTEYVEAVIKSVAEGIKKKDSYHLVIITSTVMPGETERMKFLLEDLTGKSCGESFGVIYNPDFIALGRIVFDFLNPNMILIGESDQKAGDMIEGIHSRLVDNHPEYHRMSFHNAELAKIGLNSYCTMKITYANVIGEICESMPGGDAAKVLAAIGADSRVGKKYFNAGLGYSGTCFPRDNRAFNYNAGTYGVDRTLGSLVDEINDYQKKIRIPNLVASIMREKAVDEIAILGVTYKEDVTLVEESPVIDLIEALIGMGKKVRIYDPAGMPTAKKILGDKIVYCGSAGECLMNMSVCFIGTPWKDFKELTLKFFLEMMEGDPVVFDAWGIYQNTDIADSSMIDYRQIGKLNTGINVLLPGIEIK